MSDVNAGWAEYEAGVRNSVVNCVAPARYEGKQTSIAGTYINIKLCVLLNQRQSEGEARQSSIECNAPQHRSYQQVKWVGRHGEQAEQQRNQYRQQCVPSNVAWPISIEMRLNLLEKYRKCQCLSSTS
jgi:hypothetical protein